MNKKHIIIMLLTLVWVLGTELQAAESNEAKQEAKEEAKWYRLRNIGQHYQHKPELMTLSDEQAQAYFVDKHPGFSPVFLKEVLPKLVEAAPEPLVRQQKLIIPKEKTYRIHVESVSKTRVRIHIAEKKGSWRWHHYYLKLASYELKRTQALDALFKLPDFYKKVSHEYKGIKCRSEFMLKKDCPTIKVLGKPDYSYPIASMGDGRYYFEKHDLQVEVRGCAVYYMEHGKPRWLEEKFRLKD